jgi:4-hydroxy-3-methylbut-2-enyl diphosphate reductase
MKINLAKSSGFCFGVKRAIEIALETAGLDEKVYMLGDIVHNEEVVKKIEDVGIKKIKKLKDGRNKVLLIRAHGASKRIFRKAKQLGYKIIDATCPMVKEIHKIAQNMEKKGAQIIVVGDKKHDEVLGIVGQLKNRAIVIDGTQNMPLAIIKKLKKACVVVQSTQNLGKVLRIVKTLRRYIRQLEFHNTICRPTRAKQEEIKIMPKENDVMIIIGSKSSANTKRLYEISKAINKNTYWISSKKEIKSAWFKNIKNVGITAGASTPDETTHSIINYIKKIQ